MPSDSKTREALDKNWCLPEVPQRFLAGRKYSLSEVRAWLEGWRVSDGDGRPRGGLSLEAILALLDDPEDGLAATKRR